MSAGQSGVLQFAVSDFLLTIHRMSLDALIMFSGALVALLPFLGFPNSWDAVMFLVLGLFITFLGVVVRRRRKKAPRPERIERVEVANAIANTPLHE